MLVKESSICLELYLMNTDIVLANCLLITILSTNILYYTYSLYKF